MNKYVSKTIPSFFLIYLLTNTTAVFAGEEYLFEILEEPTYRKTWDALIASQHNVDAWLANYSKTKNGPAAPGTTVYLGDRSYQINFVCKAHECGDNHFVVMFSADGKQAWGLLQKIGQDDIYFGSPDSEKIALMKAEVSR